MVKVTKEVWDSMLKDWSFCDCAIADEEFGFVLLHKDFVLLHRERKDTDKETARKSKILKYKNSSFEQLESEILDISKISCIPKNKNNLFLMLDMDGRSLFSDSDEQILGLEKPISTKLANADFVTGFSNIKRIENQLFAVASPSGIYRRIKQSRWIREKLPVLEISMYDLSGFSLTHIYAVAQKGYVWHFDGKKWNEIPRFTNEDLENVCCADEFVYIITLGGEAYKGRNDQWKSIGKVTEWPLNSVYAFGKVWISADLEIWTIDQDDQIEQYDLPEKIDGKFIWLDVAYDGQKILGCGPLGAALFDGKEWELIFDLPALSAEFDQ